MSSQPDTLSLPLSRYKHSLQLNPRVQLQVLALFLIPRCGKGDLSVESLNRRDPMRKSDDRTRSFWRNLSSFIDIWG